MKKINIIKFLFLIIVLSKVMAIETPKYKIIKKYIKVEVREYSPMIVAFTSVQESYRLAQNRGFRKIANYIFGENQKGMEIAMTAPVISTQLESNSETHEILFIMPNKYKINDLPKPNQNGLFIEKRSLNKVAVIRFGGWATKERVMHYQKVLFNEISLLGLQKVGKLMVAQYNSPWVLPPFRKNELIIQINLNN